MQRRNKMTQFTYMSSKHCYYILVSSFINTTSRYLSPLPAGPIRVMITDLQLGSKHSVLQVSLSSISQPEKLSILAVVTQGTLPCASKSIVLDDKTSSLTSKVIIPLEELPDRE